MSSPAAGESAAGRSHNEPTRPRRLPLNPLTASQQELVVRNIGLVALHLRKRVPTPHRPMRTRERADLFQAGCVALVRAAARYDPARDGAFAAFALPRIRGAVFTAAHEHFATIRVPTKVMVRQRKELAATGRTSQPPPPIAHQWRASTDQLVQRYRATDSEASDAPTIREHVRARFERAVGAALAELRDRRWKRRNPSEAMAHIAAGRVLLVQGKHQTPIREIAACLGLSSGRISEYETILHETVKRHLTRDPQLPLLIGFARQDRAGMDGRITCDHRALLLLAEMRAFDDQLHRLDRSQRAELLYRLVEQSAVSADEVLRNLFRLRLHRDMPTTLLE